MKRERVSDNTFGDAFEAFVFRSEHACHACGAQRADLLWRASDTSDGSMTGLTRRSSRPSCRSPKPPKPTFCSGNVHVTARSCWRRDVPTVGVRLSEPRSVRASATGLATRRIGRTQRTTRHRSGSQSPQGLLRSRRRRQGQAPEKHAPNDHRE
jgi:hypothetical protein